MKGKRGEFSEQVKKTSPLTGVKTRTKIKWNKIGELWGGETHVFKGEAFCLETGISPLQHLSVSLRWDTKPVGSDVASSNTPSTDRHSDA